MARFVVKFRHVSLRIRSLVFGVYILLSMSKLDRSYPGHHEVQVIVRPATRKLNIQASRNVLKLDWISVFPICPPPHHPSPVEM